MTEIGDIVAGPRMPRERQWFGVGFKTITGQMIDNTIYQRLLSAVDLSAIGARVVLDDYRSAYGETLKEMVHAEVEEPQRPATPAWQRLNTHYGNKRR